MPRAELHVAVHLLVHIGDGILAEAHIDNACVANNLHAMIAGWRPSTKTNHGALWGELASNERAMSYPTVGITRIFKIKSHLGKDEAIRAGYS